METCSGVLLISFGIKWEPRFLLVHPGGPYYEGTDLHSWSIPKGRNDGESDEVTARREFEEETGAKAPSVLERLEKFQTRKGKTVVVFVGVGDRDVSKMKSNTCVINYNGEKLTIPEIDKWEWFDFETAMQKIAFGQKQILESYRLKSLS